MIQEIATMNCNGLLVKVPLYLYKDHEIVKIKKKTVKKVKTSDSI